MAPGLGVLPSGGRGDGAGRGVRVQQAGGDAEAAARGAAGGTVLAMAPEGKRPGLARMREEAGRQFVSGCFYHPRYLSRNKEDLKVWHRWAEALVGLTTGLPEA